MSGKNFSLNNYPIDNFLSESNKIQEKISRALTDLEHLFLEDIVELYFDMIDISSISKSIKQNNETFEKKMSRESLIKIQDTQNQINEKFNETLHPLLIASLEKKISEYKSTLSTSTNPKSKTKKEIEDQAKKFEELRRLMSTKEFVNQYTKILKN